MIFKLIIIIALKHSERKLKNILQVVKLNKPPARKTTERYHLTKKNSHTNHLEVIVFKRHEVGTLWNALILEKTRVREDKCESFFSYWTLIKNCKGSLKIKVTFVTPQNERILEGVITWDLDELGQAWVRIGLHTFLFMHLHVNGLKMNSDRPGFVSVADPTRVTFVPVRHCTVLM